MLQWCRGLYFCHENESLVLHENNQSNVKNDILDSGNGVDFAFDCFVESVIVGYPADFVVLLWNDEGSAGPREATGRQKNTTFDKSQSSLVLN